MVIAHKSEARRGFRTTNETSHYNTDPSPQQRPADQTPEEEEQQRNLEAIQEAEADLDNQNAGNHTFIQIFHP